MTMPKDDVTQYKPAAAATTYYQQIEEKPLAEVEAQVAKDWQVGDVILDLYEVKEIITSGGMGLVYRVHHRGWNLDLAVKSPRSEIIASTEGKQNFIREAETWVNLGLHPHVASCHYVRTLGNVPRIFAEWVEGGSLEDWIQNGKLHEGGKEAALERILDIAIQFARGLQFAHDKGLVHQDVKPHNVLMTTEGTAKVTDFGLAKADAVETGFKPDQDASILVSTGGMTPAYCSPEQAEGKPLSLKTDIWSWAVSVLEMFTGEVTWGAGQAAPHVLESYLDTGSMKDGLLELPRELAGLLGFCFKQDPGARPESMKVITRRLGEIFNTEVGFPYPRSEPEDVELRAAELNNRAVSLLDIGMEAGARQAWGEALSLDPQHPESVYNLGLLQWRGGKITDEALLGSLRGIIQSKAGEWQPVYLLALVHLERGDCEAAIRQLEALPKKERGRLEIIQTIKQARELLPASRRCLRTFEGHTNYVSSASFSPDGRFALSGSFDNTLRLWDIETGKCLRTIEGHTDFIPCVSFSSDGRYALSGSSDKTLRLWDIDTGKNLRTFKGCTSSVNSVSFSQDGRFALSGSYNGTLRLWQVATGECLRTFKGHKGLVTSASFSPDGRCALSGGGDETLRLWDIDTGKCLRTFKGCTSSVNSVNFSPDGRFALSGSGDWDRKDNLLRLWNIETGECLRTFKGHTDRVNSVSFSPDGRFALSGSRDKTLRLWNIETGGCLRTFEGHTSSVNSTSFSPDERFALSGGYLRLWEVAMHYSHTAQFIFCRGASAQQRLTDQERFFAEIEKAQQAISEGNYHTAVPRLRRARSLPGYAYSEEAVQLWQQLYTQQPRSALAAGLLVQYSFEGHKNGVNSVSFSPDGRFALSGGSDETPRLWDIETGGCLRTFEGHTDRVNSVSFSPDGFFALSGGGSILQRDNTLRLWDVKTGECLCTFNGHTDRVNSVSFSPDGRFALSGGSDKTLRLWDIETGQCVRTFEGHINSVNSVSFSPDGRFPLSGSSDKTLRLWDIETGACLRTLSGHFNSVNSVSFSPDGYFALSGSMDYTLRLWNIETGGCLCTFKHTDRVNSVSFSPDGLFALSGGSDKTLRLWDIETGECLRTFEGHTKSVISVSFSPDGRFAISASHDNILQLWVLDWALEEKEPADWDVGAQPYLENSLILHSPGKNFFGKWKKPEWTEGDFRQLLHTLGCAGYGWLRPEGVRRKLEEMAANWQGPPPLPGK
jgi:WD40 repeat protein/serine/threonine protein kinase